MQQERKDLVHLTLPRGDEVRATPPPRRTQLGVQSGSATAKCFYVIATQDIFYWGWEWGKAPGYSQLDFEATMGLCSLPALCLCAPPSLSASWVTATEERDPGFPQRVLSFIPQSLVRFTR